MATAIKTTHRSLVAPSLPTSVPALIVYAQGIVKRMTDSLVKPRRPLGD